ncbi:MAG: DUF1972 domain-containing protein [bacterium]
MKIAIIGTRGIPARYGGFETCVQELSMRLVEKGHEVIVYCRNSNSPDRPKEFKGVKLIHLPSVRTKIADTFSHTFFSMIHVLFGRVDVILVFNAANSPLCVIPKLFGKKIAINVDGLEWKRRKWGKTAQTYYQFAEYLATKICHQIIADSKAIQQYYLKRYNTTATFIPYGADIETSSNPNILKEYNLDRDNYFFVVTRLEPENNPDLTIQAFEQVKTDKKLVIVGGTGYKSRFVQELRRTKDKRIIFMPPVYEKDHIKELFCNCYAYVHGNEVGGTNPALLSALGYGNCVLALNVPFNEEVVGEAAILYDRSTEDLSPKMQYLVDNPDVVADYRKRAVNRIKKAEYTWERVTDGYEELLVSLTAS